MNANIDSNSSDLNLPPRSEDAFFASLFRRLPSGPASLAVPPGDDCAGTELGDGRLLLSAVDQIVGGRHYFASGPNETHPYLIGRKLLARNLSDVAAMGGVPLYCLLAGSFAPGRTMRWLSALYDGVARTARAFNIHMIGGDIATTCKGDDVASITILGVVEHQNVLTRSGAKPGDFLYVTGRFGQSLITGHHLSFQPRCAEGRWLALSHYADAMMDVSDGLLIDASRLCCMSHTGLTLKRSAIPLRTTSTSLQQACEDGEDYELLISVPPEHATILEHQWPFPQTPLTPIGQFTDASTLQWEDLTPLTVKGWDHLKLNQEASTCR